MRTEVARMRCEAGVSQKELAAALGVHPVHLSKVELGKRESQSLTDRAIEALRKR